MPREGSPFQGLGTVVIKELADNLSSARMLMLELLILLTALAARYTERSTICGRTRLRIRSCCTGCLPSIAHRCRPLSPSSDFLFH